MLIVHVFVHVNPGFATAFKIATTENAQQSIQEPGIARFDVVQEIDDPNRFLLVETYKSEAAPAAHKETAHYLKWRDTVAGMMAEPRRSVKYAPVFPSVENW
ncbi:MAG: Antibiotic biosynthesis monooxygenase [Verrucomicrobiales bacterium]|nr:Antibiotic biosynthesis monooxygenase [Verrucomicrobiales bacterium]MDB6131288.1 Antibiotic biosynthesis monooxygenase [Verrucomicrobiales bacterium]